MCVCVCVSASREVLTFERNVQTLEKTFLFISQSWGAGIAQLVERRPVNTRFWVRLESRPADGKPSNTLGTKSMKGIIQADDVDTHTLFFVKKPSWFFFLLL